MKPDELLKLVIELAVDMDLTYREVRMLQRFFLKQVFRYMTLRQISMLTGGGHDSTVGDAILTVESNKKFLLPRYTISHHIQKRIDQKIRIQSR